MVEPRLRKLFGFLQKWRIGITPFLTLGPLPGPAGGCCPKTYIPEDAQLHRLFYTFKIFLCTDCRTFFSRKLTNLRGCGCAHSKGRGQINPFLWLGSMGISIHMGWIRIRNTFAIVRLLFGLPKGCVLIIILSIYAFHCPTAWEMYLLITLPCASLPFWPF